MNMYKRQILWCGFVAYLSVPGIAYSAPGPLADQPLWLGTAVKHNLMFAIDDSGSMDWELSFPVRDGTPRVLDNGNFIDATGAYSTSTSRSRQYAYLFPNGGNTSSYDGRRLYTDRHALPPIPQYGSARSAAYNTAYYDPSVNYVPWPTYAEYTDDTFAVPSVTATPFEPVVSAFGLRTINLFSNLNTGGTGYGANWEFDIRDSDMVCEEDGRSNCSVGGKHYTYYPGTYYSKDTTSKYYYNAIWSGSPISSSTSELVEAEDYNSSNGEMKNSADLFSDTSGAENTRISNNRSTSLTSVGDFIGTKEVVGPSFNTAPSDGNATYNVAIPASGTVSIWIRNNGISTSTDSVWARLHGYDSSSVTLENPGSTNWDGEYGPMRESVSTDGSWTWTKWGEVDLTVGTYTFEVAYREGGFLMDQFLFTTETDTPSGILSDSSSFTGDERDCSNPAHTTPAVYLEWARNPSRFRTSNSSPDLFDGFGFDGACLKKYEIGVGQADGDNFDNGAGIARTVLEEKQNFATWFTYYRRRHQAMRGGLASAVQGINGVKLGMFWLNDTRTVNAADMKDVSVAADVETFLDEHYSRVARRGTPLRSALNHARNQFASRTGPITSECQKNYTLLFTDGFNTETSFSGVSGEDNSAGAPYQDSYNGTLGDIAYKAYNDNLRTDLEAGSVRVADECAGGSPDPWLDCNTNPHMNTYTVGLGIQGNMFGVTHNTVQDAHDNPPTWPQVTTTASEGLPQVDDLYHAAVNGRGEMYAANSPDTLKAALRSAIDDIVESIGSGSGVTFNSSSLRSTDGTAIYTTLFNSANWSGDLRGRLLNQNTGAVEDLVWTDSNGDGVGVAAILDERVLSTEPRVILTTGVTRDGSDNVTASNVGTAFAWSNLSDTQRADLRTNPDATSSSDAYAQERLDFIRGERGQEGNAFRARGSRMADVIHSAPAYVGIPSSDWPNQAPFGTAAERYETFAEKTIAQGGYSDRIPAVYVGANGGMLHAFNAQNTGTDAGKELMAYIPSMVYSATAGEGLHYLTDPNYSHRNYVDLTPVTQDVYTSNDWRTMLVGGLRGGGKGLFALDVTDPTKFSETDTTSGTALAADSTVMWEYTEADDASFGNNLGFLTSPPLIAMLNDNKWAVIFGNGYESINGRAALMILYIEEGLDGWTTGDVRVIDTGVGSPSDKNGLSGLTAVDLDSDSIPDRIYAGDIKGNMWAFDISSGTASNWDVAYSDVSSNPEPLFTAKDSGGTAQPITAAPSIAFNSDQRTGGAPNLLVSFGTGQYLVSGDQADVDVQSFYTVWDDGAITSSQAYDRADLASRTITETNDIRQFTGATINWANDQGWYVDFVVTGESAEGERVTQRPITLFDSTVGPIALFASLIPDTSECSGGGSSVLYALPLLSGLNPTKPILDLDGDGDFDNNDLGVGKTSSNFINDPNVLGNNIYSAQKDQSGSVGGGSGGGTGVDQEKGNWSTDSEREGRLGWFELIQK